MFPRKSSKKTFHNDGLREGLLEALGRFGLTALIIFVLLLLSTFPLRIAGLHEIRPAFLLIAVYYWAIYRPYMLRPTGAFVGGLVLDLLSGLPPGLSSLTLVVVQAITGAQQKFMLAQGYAVVWSCFALTAFLAGSLQWLVMSLIESSVMSIRAVLMAALLTTLIYPLITWPLYLLNRALDDRALFR